MRPGRLHERRANVGGPMSRSRSQPIRASLLQGDGATFDCRRQLGVDFGEHDPIEAVHAALRAARVPDPESLRARFALPAEPCLCREVPALAVPHLQDLAAEDLLERALLLGLGGKGLKVRLGLVGVGKAHVA